MNSINNSHILSLLGDIKERLNNLRIQRKYIPNANTPLFPFASSLDLIQKITNEEEYLLKEAAKLKDSLKIDKSENSFGKDLSSLGVYTIL